MYQVNSCFLPVNKQKKDLRLSQGGGQTEFNSTKQKFKVISPGFAARAGNIYKYSTTSF